MYGIRSALVLATLVTLSTLPPRDAAAQSFANQVWDQLQAVYSVSVENGEYNLRNYILGKLNDDQTDSWTFYFNENSEYLITAACDNDCGDIDIKILDSDGDVVASDNGTDDVPVVRLSTKGAARYTVEVKMYECSSEPCYWGFGIFNR